MITLEDLAEELVGEITDEHDADVDPDYVPVEGDGVWEMAGDVHVDEVERALAVDLPRGALRDDRRPGHRRRRHACPSRAPR